MNKLKIFKLDNNYENRMVVLRGIDSSGRSFQNVVFKDANPFPQKRKVLSPEGGFCPRFYREPCTVYGGERVDCVPQQLSYIVQVKGLNPTKSETLTSPLGGWTYVHVQSRSLPLVNRP